MAGKFFMSLINEDFTTALYVSRAARGSGLSSPLTLCAPQLLQACIVSPSHLSPLIHFAVRSHCFIFSSEVQWWELQYQLVQVFFSSPPPLCYFRDTFYQTQVFVPPAQTTATVIVARQESKSSDRARGCKQRKGWIRCQRIIYSFFYYLISVLGSV